MQIWHTQTVESVVNDLTTNLEQGLDPTTVQQRQQAYGRNELISKGGKHPLKLLWEQASSTMVLILIVATGLSAFLGKITEAAAIGAIVVLFVILGFVQEYRAEQAMAALKKLAVPIVRVVRGGRRELSARELVPGDVVLLEAAARAGRRAPGGERQPADPGSGPDRRVGGGGEVDRRAGENGVAAAGRPASTWATWARSSLMAAARPSSSARAWQTELGQIATLIQDVGESSTPLQRRLDGVGKLLALVGVVVAGWSCSSACPARRPARTCS
jgi:Ca2+-transporting ATPase